MKWIILVFGEGKDLDTLQMCSRAIIAFVIALILIRLAGQRTFGKNSAVDNVIIIMLGAVLSRAVVGASPFIPVVCACTAMSLTHRILTWLSMYNHGIGKIVKGEPTCLYRNGSFEEANLKKLLISRKDLMEGVRLRTNADSLDNVDAVYIERNGQISVVKKAEKG